MFANKRFARDAMAAHVVYSPEVRHPVEVAAAEQQHLVQWLSKRLGTQLKAPVLQAQGFDLGFIRTWAFYLAYCEAGFRAKSIDLYQFTLQKS